MHVLHHFVGGLFRRKFLLYYFATAGSTVYKTAQIGDNVMFQCQITSTEYSWEHKPQLLLMDEFVFNRLYKPGRKFEASNPPKYNETFVSNTSYLTVFDVNVNDSGTYRCVIVTGGSTTMLYTELVVFGETRHLLRRYNHVYV